MGRGVEVRLYPALGVSEGDVVSFVGAGGKSGAIIAVAGELARDGVKVLVVPTTKMLVSEAEWIGPVVTEGDLGELRRKVEEALSDSEAVVAGGGLISKSRIAGVAPEDVQELSGLAGVVLVEADGSRRRPIKGTADHEPALPPHTTLVVAVGNVEALGKPVDEEHVHRPELFSGLTGVAPGQSITARAFARALAEGSLHNVPDGARTAALITGVEPGQPMSNASIVARELWRMGVKKVVFASLKHGQPARVWNP
jgi:molybdenum cofactor cytidylyltransferase